MQDKIKLSSYRIFSKEPHALWLRCYINVDEYLLAASPIYAVSHINDKVLLAHAAEPQPRYMNGLFLGAMGAPIPLAQFFLKAL